jgi:hypothetical protein
MTNYAVPGQGQGLVRGCLGYLAAGIIGVSATAGLMYLIAKFLVRKNRSSKHD